MWKYSNGLYDFIWAYKNGSQSWNWCAPNWLHIITKFDVPPITNFYKSLESFKVKSFFAEDGHWYSTNCPEWDPSFNAFHKSHAYEILGRMCHLLQDMAVPAHVHANSHAGQNGMYSDQ